MYHYSSIFATMIATYKYKIYDTHRIRKVEKLFGLACWVYNHCIALYKRYYSLYGKHLHVNKLKVHLTKLKKQAEYTDWNLRSSQSIQHIAEKIDLGYKKFFKKQAKRPPTFRSRRKYNSICFKNTGWSINGNIFTINSLKCRLPFFKSRDIAGDVKTVTVKKDACGDYHVCFSLDNVKNDRIKAKSGKSAGFDFGLKTFLIASDGNDIVSPLHLFHSLDKLRKASKKISKKQKGSNSRKKARLSLARLHRKISNQREDFQWKTAIDLVSRYDVICFEDLNIKAVRRLWGRKISDLSFSSFLCKVEYLATKHDKKVVKIDRFFASSKTCSVCGEKEELTLKDRTWRCPHCGTDHDRDLNAAYNILKVGASTLGVETVRPALVG